MNARSRSACGVSAIFSGILQVTHITSCSIVGSVVRTAGLLGGVAASVALGIGKVELAASSVASAIQMHRRAVDERRVRATSCALPASAIARSRKAVDLSRDGVATIRPWRSMTKLSGSCVVPYELGEASVDVAQVRVGEVVPDEASESGESSVGHAEHGAAVALKLLLGGSSTEPRRCTGRTRRPRSSTRRPCRRRKRAFGCVPLAAPADACGWRRRGARRARWPGPACGWPSARENRP